MMNGSVLRQARRLVLDVERELHPLATRKALAYWRQATEGNETARDEFRQARSRLHRFLAQEDLFAEVAALRVQVDRRDDEYVKRQLDILYAMLLPHRQDEEWLGLQEELEAEIAGFYLADEVNGQSEARAREAAPLVLRLIKARNQGARSAGFPDYYSLALAASELTQTALFALLDALEEASEAPYHKLLHGRASQGAVNGVARKPEAGSLDSVFADRDPVSLAADYFDAIGFRVDKVISQSDLFDRPGKPYQSFCLDVDAAGDVRVFCRAGFTENGARTLLHHLGRAVYYLNIAKEFPYLIRRPAHGFTVEASGHLFEAMLYDPFWLEDWAGLSRREAEETLAALKERKRAEDALRVRRELAWAHLERALYQQPQADPDEMWGRFVERFLGTKERQKSGQLLSTIPHWAANGGLVTAPLAQPNRLLGLVAGAQLGRMVEEELGEGAMALSPAAGYLLIDRWFAHGARFVWEELVQMAFGGPLDVGAFVERRLGG